MKRIAYVLICLLFASSSLAQEDPSLPPQKSFLESVIEAMAQQYVESVAKDLVIQQLEKYASKVLMTDLSGTISSSLAIIGLFENAQDYSDASSEGERYQAFSHGVANAVTVVAPGVGFFVQLGVLSHDLGAAYVSKDFQLRLAQTIADTAKLERRSSEMILEEFKQEKSVVEKMSARSLAVNALIKATLDKMPAECAKSDTDLLNPKRCLRHIFLYQQLLAKQVNTFEKYLKFNGRFINVALLLGSVGLRQLEISIKEAKIKIKGNVFVLNRVLSEYAFSEVNHDRNAVGNSIVARHCEVMLLESVSKVLNLKKWRIISPSEDWISYAFDEEKGGLRTLINGICSDSALAISEDLRALVREQLR